MAGRRSSAPEPTPKVQVPHQTLDPSWSLEPWPVVMTLHGQDYEFPAATASMWLAVLMPNPPDLDDVIRTMMVDGRELLFDEQVGEELYEACLEVISTVAGRPWWQALRLIQVAVSNWNVLGAEMLYRGFLPSQVSLSAWLDVLLLVTIRLMDPKDVMMFTLQLENPPAALAEAFEDDEPTMSRQAFLALGQ